MPAGEGNSQRLVPNLTQVPLPLAVQPRFSELRKKTQRERLHLQEAHAVAGVVEGEAAPRGSLAELAAGLCFVHMIVLNVAALK